MAKYNFIVQHNDGAVDCIVTLSSSLDNAVATVCNFFGCDELAIRKIRITPIEGSQNVTSI